MITIYKRSKPYKIIRISSIFSHSLLLVISVQSLIIAQTTEEYRWKNVQIRGGGFVTGIIYNTAEEGLLYARTDVGGNTGKVPCIVNSIIDNELNNIYCTPNPFITEMCIQAGAPFKYSIVDMNGLQFESDSCNGDCYIGKNLQSGVYILTISHNNESKRIKIIKQHNY